MPTLKDVVEQNDTPLGRTFDLFIQLLIVLSLIGFSVETLPNLSPSTRRYLSIFEAITVAIFTVEYVIRLLVADNKLRFSASSFGVIDLLAIRPFFPVIRS